MKYTAHYSCYKSDVRLRVHAERLDQQCLAHEEVHASRHIPFKFGQCDAYDRNINNYFNQLQSEE